MNIKKLFNRHYQRLVFEGVLKSALFGLAIGCGTVAVLGIFVWLFELGGVWLPIGVGAGVGVLTGVGAYFLKNRPSLSSVAKRMDRLGLKERTVTMLELDGDDSYIATVQRENAIDHIEQTKGRKISLKVPRALVALTAVAFILGSTMTTVIALASEDIIPSGGDLLPKDPETLPFAVSYMVDEGGEIVGESDQLVEPGMNTTPVVAVADDGWVFVGWDDGNESPERQELEVTKDMIFVAVFEEIVDGGEGETDDDGKEGPGSGEGDKADDVPGGGDSSSNSEQNGQGDKGDASGSDGNSEGGQGSGEDQGEGKGDGQGAGAGGKWEESNQFKDGQTYYKDYLDLYYEYAIEIFKENGEIPPELREFYEAYIDSI